MLLAGAAAQHDARDNRDCGNQADADDGHHGVVSRLGQTAVGLNLSLIHIYAEKLRGMVSDAATYDKILEMLESDSAPQFIFDVTMQNLSLIHI